ncbi:MAG: hypothetical protein DMF51_04085 [Acidobacteria bacterium]|nr:MAG: hypothetical protein DMF51_04085 [Acidobacteriota bacterium]
MHTGISRATRAGVSWPATKARDPRRGSTPPRPVAVGRRASGPTRRAACCRPGRRSRVRRRCCRTESSGSSARGASARSIWPGASGTPRWSRRRSASRSAGASTDGCARRTSASCWTDIRAYCLALEYACHGDLRAFLHRAEAGWPEKTVRREIAGILEVLRKLHRGQLLHRDLTPMNVFVCDGPSLKLGDFGIVRQQSDRGGVAAGTMNALTAPSDILAGAVPKWQARDDVYQVGQLLGMLVRGDASARLRTFEIRRLACGDHLKEIIHRCLGERRKRYESADDLIEALRNPPAPLKAGVLRSLKGVHLAFTGILSKRRDEAARAARRAGARVHGGPSARTTVVVRGRPNPLQAAGRDAGLKLMEIKRLRAKGHKITLLDERQFWRLARKR